LDHVDSLAKAEVTVDDNASASLYQPVSGSLSSSCTKLDADAAIPVGALLFVLGANSSIPRPSERVVECLTTIRSLIIQA
jgi:hypothetical protein